MKILHNGIHVKTIPVKFAGIKNLPERFKDSKKKRLTTPERFLLEFDLFKLEVASTRIGKYAMEFIGDAPPPVKLQRSLKMMLNAIMYCYLATGK